MLPNLSVVVLNFNRKKDSVELISSLNSQNYRNFEIIYVDNNSSDGSAEEIQKRFSKIKVIHSPKNIGRAGHNLGAKIAKGEVLVFLDADILLPKDFLQKLESKFKNKKVDAVSFFMKDPSGKTYGWEPNFDPKTGESTFGGGMWAIKRKIFEKVGDFNPDIFVYVDEWDYLLRMWNKGSRVLYFPDLVGTHKESPYVYRSVMRGYQVIVNFAQLYALYLPIVSWGRFLKHHISESKNVFTQPNLDKWGAVKGLALAGFYFLKALPKRKVVSQKTLKKFMRFYFPQKGDIVVGKWGWK